MYSQEDYMSRLVGIPTSGLNVYQVQILLEMKESGAGAEEIHHRANEFRQHNLS